MGKPGRPRHPDVLTPREWEVLALLRDGLSNEQIAQRLGISFDGAKYHVSEIITKLGVRDRRAAARWQADDEPQHSLFAIFAVLRRPHLSMLTTPIGASIIAVAVIAVGALAWGVATTRESGGSNGTPAQSTMRANPGAGEKATEAGIVPWTTLRISDGGLPQAVTVPFTEYMLATQLGAWPDGPQAPAPPTSETSYRLEFVRAADGVTPVGSPGTYVDGTTPTLQPPSIGASAPQAWQQPSPGLAALLDRYIALARAGVLTERPTFTQSITPAKPEMAASVSVDGRALPALDRDMFLSLFGAASPVRFGLRGTLIGQRALNAATVEVRLGAETLTFSYIPPGPVAPYGLLMNTPQIGNWELTTLLDPPAYAQYAYSVPRQFDDLLARLGFASGTPAQNADTRIMPLLDADMTMRIERVLLSDGARDISVQGVDPDSIDCPPGVDVCGPETAPLPATGRPLTLTVSRHGIDPFPEAERAAAYAYYPPGTAGGRGILVQTKAGWIWNATLGRDGGDPFYASAATDAALGAAVRQLGG